MKDVTTLYRPVGEMELNLIRESGFSSFPPRLPEQPFFYPVLTESYAIQIARDWNAKYNVERCGYLTRFSVANEFLDSYEVRTVGGSEHKEYWIPAEDLDDLNSNIIGKIEVLAEYRAESAVRDRGFGEIE